MPPTSSLEWWRPAGAESVRPARAARGTDSSVPFWALMMLTFVMLISPQTFFPVLDSFRIALVVALIATATYVLDRISHRRSLGLNSREMLLAASLAAWAAVTIPLSYNPENSAAVLLNGYSKTLILFWLVSNVVDSAKRLKQTCVALTLMAIPLALTGIEHFLSGVYLTETGQARISGYDAPLTGNPNDLALMLNLILPLNIALLLSCRKAGVRVLLLLGAALSAASIIVTFSRAGFLALASSLLLYIWKLRRRPQRRWLWLLIPVILISIPALGPAYLERLSTITNMEADKTGSAQERWSDMAAAAQFTLSHPIFGAGLGQNVLATQEERGANGGLVHDVYLEYSAELGLPGLALFLLLLVASLNSAVLVQRRATQANLRDIFYIGEALQLSLIAFTISAIFHPVAYHIYFYYIAGLAVAGKGIPQLHKAVHGST